MDFSVNSPIIYVFVSVILLAILGQALFFGIRAIKRAKELGVPKETVVKTIKASAVFSIAPAIAITIGVLTLTKSLGIPLPWFRLSVIGSLTYEASAFGSAMEAMGLPTGVTITDPDVYITVVWVMSSGVLAGIILPPLIAKPLRQGIIKINQKDAKWGKIFGDAMFMGMIAAFLGLVFADVSNVFTGDVSGLIPVCVMGVSALVMIVCGSVAMKSKITWLKDYALPISMICGMAAAIPFTAWLG